MPEGEVTGTGIGPTTEVESTHTGVRETVDVHIPGHCYGYQFTLPNDDAWHLLNEQGLVGGYFAAVPVVVGQPLPDRATRSVEVHNLADFHVQIGGVMNADQALAGYPGVGARLSADRSKVVTVQSLGRIAVRNLIANGAPATISVFFVSDDK